MLKVSLEDLNDSVCTTIDSTFNYYKKPEWFDRDNVREVIAGIDKTTVVEGEFLRSPVLGAMSPDRLSTGCKAVILMILNDYKVYATRCGDNCSEYILKAAENKDITIVLHHVMKFKEPFEIYVCESGKTVRTMEEFINEFYTYRC